MDEPAGGKGAMMQNAGLTELGQIAVTVDDVERATAFYRDVLGVPFLFDAPGLSFFDLGGTRLMLSRPEGVERSSSLLYFRTPDIKAAHELLLGQGVDFIEAPQVVHRADNYDIPPTDFVIVVLTLEALGFLDHPFLRVLLTFVSQEDHSLDFLMAFHLFHPPEFLTYHQVPAYGQVHLVHFES